MIEKIPGYNRIEAIEDYKKDFNTIIDKSFVMWGLQDQFFTYNGHAYYHKPWLKSYLQEDIHFFDEEKIDLINKRKPIYDSIIEFLGYEIPGMTPQKNLNFMREMIFKNPKGLPKFLEETDNFFHFKLEGKKLKHISIDDLNKNVLDNISKYITDNYNPFLTPYFSQSIYQCEYRYYCMDILAYYYNPKCQFGIFLDPDFSKKYENAKDNSYFFTFKDITEEEKRFALLLGNLHTDYKNSTNIIEYKNL